MEGDFHLRRSDGNVCEISIHSLRMEGDWLPRWKDTCPPYFNPLPPHGGRLCRRTGICTDWEFQSTPSAWRETWGIRSRRRRPGHFNPLPPHGGRRLGRILGHGHHISIHSLRMEGDAGQHTAAHAQRHFNPLPPHGGRPSQGTADTANSFISIHSLRMEGDIRAERMAVLYQHFNPLPPHGGRPAGRCLPPALPGHFNPLPPHGGRPSHASCSVMVVSFQSTPSAWRETLIYLATHRVSNYFNPLPPHGGRRAVLRVVEAMQHFNPLPPHGGRHPHSLL